MAFRASQIDPALLDRNQLGIGRVRWIIGLRWTALLGIALAVLLSMAGFYPGVAWPVLLAVLAGAGVYNLVVWRRHRHARTAARSEALRQAVVDMGLLTVVLWAAGGMRTPFIGYYVFHVAIVGILGGRRATLVAGLAALMFSFLLLVTEHTPALQIAQWNPTWPWDVVAELAAFGSTVGVVAYLVTHAAEELRLRELELMEARERAALELEVLTNTLNELEAGLEVVEKDGAVLWRNKRAEEIAPTPSPSRWACPGEERPCEHDTTGVCPVSQALAAGDHGQCRFAAMVDGEERVFEMTVYPLGPGPNGRPRVMNLYLDRTQTLMAERTYVLAERLASLGRVTQGVAHELNTPLATIRTLSADMVAALRAAGHAPDASLLADLGESAALVHDETRRLGRITQGLLTGRDLAASPVSGSVPLSAAVERARVLVFAGGAQDDVGFEVDEHLADHPVVADADRLVQVLVNLVQNAHDAVKEHRGGLVRVSARRANGHVEIVVDDDGPGISEEMEAALFEPFATTKPPGKGTGLGLYTTYMLVSRMNGTVTLENRAAGGARAVVRLPAAEPDVPLSAITRAS